jgi:hypothetical protein
MTFLVGGAGNASAALLSVDQILSGSVTVTTNGPDISATFRPNNSLSLAEAASEIGFDLGLPSGELDHFNWVQTIIAKPSYLQYSILPGNTPTPQAILDPILNSSLNSYLVTNTNLGKSMTVTYDPTWFGDGQVPYWNEPIGSLPTLPDGVNVTTVDALNFEDSPYLPPGWLNPGDFKGYETQLVGVNSTGKLVRTFAGYGTTFFWDTDTIRASQQVFASLDDGTLPPLISGGVFNVQTDSAAPEPATFTLLGISMAWMVAYCWRRRRHSSR